jgi:hypothetical protein
MLEPAREFGPACVHDSRSRGVLIGVTTGHHEPTGCGIADMLETVLTVSF